MIRIGAINIDTSHPKAFGETLEVIGRGKYVAVYDDSFRSDDEVNGFIKRFKLEKRCSSLEELAEMCDIGFIHSCNWDDHLRLAKPFFDKGKPIFIDKPLVGSIDDCKKVEILAKEGKVILGSSSVRYCYEIQNYLNTEISERGDIIQVYGTSGVDEFNYGIHIVEGGGGLIGDGAEWVRYVGSSEVAGNKCESYFVSYKNGIGFTYTTLSGVWQPFTMTIMTTKTTHQFTIDANRLYQALLEQILNYMEGKANLLASPTSILESIKIMIAGKTSKISDGKKCMIDSLDSSSPSFDGNSFYNNYSANAGKLYS